ncbi:hypothetical protein N431DRAFT_493670 [Stipitochalara longipes BDJ]|nr:hypothetical protein N431DRAFT_493670 [Stipitochalara longipes BDJ]
MSTKKWANGPYKLLSTPRAALKGHPESGASRNASEMALIHNIILRGLNCIILQAPNVKKPEDILDFMAFCDAWSCTLHSHHNTEETVYFPLLEEQSAEPGVMAKNHAEHETFLPGLSALDEYIRAVRADVKSYDGTKFVKIIEGFGPALEKHLQNEIVLLESLAKDEKINWDLLGKTMAAHSKKVADKVREVPFLITNSDVTYDSGIHGERFPPFPWFVHQIFRWVYIPQLKGAWRFASCDDCGMPKELPFA